MTCGSCGATIADKAIVCYRCGAPTSAPGASPVRPPAFSRKSRAGPLVLVVIGVLLLAAALVLPPDTGTGRDVVGFSGLALTIIGGIRLILRRR